MPEEVLNKIKYLCGEISEDEWSGVLFYTVEGTISQYDKMVITLQDVLPLDKGTKTFTGYDLDEQVTDYLMEDPTRMSWKMGHIHSHNTMAVYFSGTDMSELQDNSEFHNYYLSLIVNNYMKMTAKVAFRGSTNGYSCKNEEGEEWTLNLTENKETMFTFECDIKLEKEAINLPKAFVGQVAKIISAAKKKVKTVSKGWKNVNISSNKKQSNREQFSFNPFDKPLKDVTWKDTADTDIDEGFMIYVLRLGEIVDNDTIEMVVEDLNQSELNVEEYASHILNMYVELYEKYWTDFQETDTEQFVSNTNRLVELVEEHCTGFDFSEPIQTKLQMMLNRLELV